MKMCFMPQIPCTEHAKCIKYLLKLRTSNALKEFISRNQTRRFGDGFCGS